MRTVLAGFRAARRTPLALAPLTFEGLIAAALVLAGILPAHGSSAPAAAIFPLDVYFDVRQVLSFGEDWIWVAGVVAASVMARALVLGATVWLSERDRGRFVVAWVRAAGLAAMAALAVFPSAALFFVGVATRYAPFIWVAAVVGAVTALLVARRAARLDVGPGRPSGRGVPGAPAFLLYGYLIAAVAAAMSILSRDSPWPAALLFAALGPLHALVFLGWREHMRAGTYPGGGVVAAVATVLVVIALVATAGYDRLFRDPEPVRKVSRSGNLLVLGGADSTTSTGALSRIDPRDLGFPRARMRHLSYRGAGNRYRAKDTRADLDEVARRVADQIAKARKPRYLLGHSQVALIVDRIADKGLVSPDRSIELAPSPPIPPPVTIPPPGKPGPGRPGGDVARALSKVLDAVGLQPFDVDAPASPTNLERVVVRNSKFPRLAVWVLGDSVWLDRDWRRPGETNVVALTDHVGVANNAVAYEATRDFLKGKRVKSDEGSWKSAAVAVLRYAFEPWRPR